jgi:hypothetical protein
MWEEVSAKPGAAQPWHASHEGATQFETNPV